LGSTVGLTLLWLCVVTGGREVDVSLATVDESTLLGLESSSSVGSIDEFNVTETLGSA